MDLQKLFEDAQMSIKHGLAPIKATMLAAAILTVTGVFSIGLFSLLALSLCLYNAGRRTLSMYLESSKSSQSTLATDSMRKVETINTSFQMMKNSADLQPSSPDNPVEHVGQIVKESIKVVEATLGFTGADVVEHKPSTLNMS